MLTHLLSRARAANPAKTAVVHGRRRVSYEELDRSVARCAGGLRALGVRAGTCVAIVLPNCTEFIITVLACARLRAVALPLNPLFTQEELRRFLLDARCNVVVTDMQRVAACAPITHQLGDARIVVVGGALADGASFDSLLQADPIPAESALFDGPGLYLYTSGSTETFKRVCCTQSNLHFEALNFVETVGLTADDTILCTIPLYHSYGIGNCMLDALYAGSTLVLLDPEGETAQPFAARSAHALELIRSEGVRFYPGAPYQFAVLAALPRVAAPDLAPVRLCVSSGDVLPRATFDRFLARYGLPIRSLYGSTEAGSISLNIDPPIEFGSLGPPLRNVIIEIRDPDDGRVLDAGQAGRIWVKSPTIPPGGYDNRPDLGTGVFRDGFYDSGDLGLMTARRHLVLLGRKQSFVDVAGYKVDIAEVEEVLSSHPLVTEAAVLGVDVPNMGTLVKAVLVVREPCREADIRAWCRERLAFFKIPRLIEFAASLPRSAIGKVLKSELADTTAYLSGISDGREGLARRIAGVPRTAIARILEEFVHAQVSLILAMPPSAVPREEGFAELGMDSLTSLELCLRLEYALGWRLPSTIAYDHPTVAELAQALARRALDAVATVPSQTRPAASLDGLSRQELTAELARELGLSGGTS
jgi:long-chain acyl-CoA synthetase